MGFFRRKNKVKEQRAARINDAFNRVYTQMGELDNWDDPKKLEHYILDSCEQIIAFTKELEHQKSEYRTVTAYLNDIKAIEDLPSEDAAELKGLALRIKELENAILNAKSVTRNITDEQYEVISQEEDAVPNVINRMAEDERYQDKVKRNINVLEGEKSRWEMEREHNTDENKMLKSIVTVVMTSFMAIVLLLFVVSQATGFDFTIPLLIVFGIGAFSGFFVFIKQSNIKVENKKALVRLNQAIRMLNVERIKYVNITNGIEYQKDKFHVESSSELQYVWQQYIDKVKDQQRAVKNNEDLEFYLNKLERFLRSMKLHDYNIWLNQIDAIISHDELIEVRHRLVVRRQKIRARIEENQEMVKNERNEIDRLMLEHKHYLPEIQEIIRSVDKLCGTSTTKSAIETHSKSMAV